MRILIQRVKEASVQVDHTAVGAIQKGLLVFLGIHASDTKTSISWHINKLTQLRIFPDESGKMNYSIIDIQGDVLVISQFTLYGNCTRGRRPDFIDAAPPDIARPLYESFIRELSLILQKPVQTGIFGAHMTVFSVNEGPATFFLEH